jgi:hypothetical protein
MPIAKALRAVSAHSPLLFPLAQRGDRMRFTAINNQGLV